MGKRQRRKRALRNRYGRDPHRSGVYQKWDAEKERFYWARTEGHWDEGAKKWVSGVKPANWAPTAPLYFAYGSNLHMGQMARRCPEATPWSKFIYPGWRLVFRGVADIEYAPGFEVQGGLWRITGADEAALDTYEGVRSGLYIKDYFLIHYTDAEGERQVERVLVYLMGRETGQYAPGKYYLETIRQGYQNFGLKEERLDEAVEIAKLAENLSEERVTRANTDWRYRQNSQSQSDEASASERYAGWGGCWSDYYD